MLQIDDTPDFGLDTPAWFRRAMVQEREEGFADAGGCPIHYFRWGDPSKPGVILLHGFLAHARVFAFIAPLMTEDFHVVAYDLGGMGESGFRDAYDAETQAADLMAVAEDTGMFDGGRKPFLVSHSYGGGVAMDAVEQSPDRFSGLIVTDMMMLRPDAMKEHMGERMDRRQNTVPQKNKVYPDLETAMGRFRLQPEQPCENDYLFKYLAFHSLKKVEGGWSWKFHPSIFNRDIRTLDAWLRQPHRLAEIALPKAIIYGENSTLFTRDSSAYLREINKDPLPIIEVPDAHHHLMLDQPVAYASAIKSVLTVWANR